MKSTIFASALLGLAIADKFPDYQQVNDSVNVPTYQAANLQSLYRSTGDTKATNANVFNTINIASQSASQTSTRSIDSLFLRLPSSTELDQLILGADSVGILKTIQTVATDDSIPCEQRIAYLLELLGRIRTAIERKTFAADQLRVIIDGARTEIARLQSEIAKLRKNITDLWLDELNDKLSAAIKDLENAYNQFNFVEAQIAPNEAKVAGYEKEIEILTNNADQERNRIANDRLKLVETEAKIRDLESQLAAARNRKAALEESIRKGEANIAEIEAKIAAARDNIKKLEAEIRRLRNQADTLRAKVNELEIQVERLRTDINVAKAKEDRFLSQIAALQDRINTEEKKLATKDLDDLNRKIDTLRRLVPTTEKEIDRHYYYCYGEGNVQVEQTGSVVVYIVRGERVNEYLNRRYAQNSHRGQQGDLRLQKVDIFNAQWTGKYGYPAVVGNNKNGDDFSGSFSCFNGNASVKGYGIISNIGADFIEARDDKGKNNRFHFSSCSRLEATNDTPKLGQGFYYEAVPSSADGYNLIAGSCI